MVPESLIWILSASCNLSCRHCYSSRLASKKTYPEELYMKTLKEIMEMGPSSLGFTGGEPLMFPYLKELVGISVERIPKITIATNGTLIDEAWVKFFSGFKEHLHIYVSLDGLERSHDVLRGPGSFKKALTGAKLVAEAGINLHIMMAISPHNFRESADALKLSHDLGAKTFSMIPIMPSGRAKSEIIPSGTEFLNSVELALSEAEKLKMELDVWCAPFVSRILESPILRVPCCRKMDVVDISPDFDILLCDVIDIKLSNILKEGSFVKALSLARKKERLKPPDVCESCGAFEKCLGGCFSRSFIAYGRFDLPDPMCPFLEELNKRDYPQ